MNDSTRDPYSAATVRADVAAASETLERIDEANRIALAAAVQYRLGLYRLAPGFAASHMQALDPRATIVHALKVADELHRCLRGQVERVAVSDIRSGPAEELDTRSGAETGTAEVGAKADTAEVGTAETGTAEVGAKADSCSGAEADIAEAGIAEAGTEEDFWRLAEAAGLLRSAFRPNRRRVLDPREWVVDIREGVLRYKAAAAADTPRKRVNAPDDGPRGLEPVFLDSGSSNNS